MREPYVPVSAEELIAQFIELKTRVEDYFDVEIHLYEVGRTLPSCRRCFLPEYHPVHKA